MHGYLGETRLRDVGLLLPPQIPQEHRRWKVWQCFILSFFFSHSASTPAWSGGERLGGVEDRLAKTKWFKAVETVGERSTDNKIGAKKIKKTKVLGKKISLFSQNWQKNPHQLQQQQQPWKGKRFYLCHRLLVPLELNLQRSRGLPAAALTPIYLSKRHMTYARLTFAPSCG